MLSCSCSDDLDWWYHPPNDFVKFNATRNKRCVSCKQFVGFYADCLEFSCFRKPYSFIEECIYGDEVQLANQYLCESCGEIFLNLEALGYCMNLGDNLKEDLKEYWQLTGFNRKDNHD